MTNLVQFTTHETYATTCKRYIVIHGLFQIPGSSLTHQLTIGQRRCYTIITVHLELIDCKPSSTTLMKKVWTFTFPLTSTDVSYTKRWSFFLSSLKNKSSSITSTCNTEYVAAECQYRLFADLSFVLVVNVRVTRGKQIQLAHRDAFLPASDRVLYCDRTSLHISTLHHAADL